jgi:hypothetical protein
MRFCRMCDKLMPIASFAIGKRRYLCIDHHRALKREDVLGTPEKRAFNSLRCRARRDMVMFGHPRMEMGMKQLLSMLSAEQIAEYTKYSLVPIVPSKPLTKDNAVIITGSQRKFVFGNWKSSSQDDTKYKSALEFILNAPDL